jgi:hypothetical protein
MPDTFVPMAPAMISGTGNGFTPLPSKPGPWAAGKPSPAGNGHAATTPALAPAHACGAPKVTLQRQGEVISSIRIQCGCGQVIELNCVY